MTICRQCCTAFSPGICQSEDAIAHNHGFCSADCKTIWELEKGLVLRSAQREVVDA